jgi:hypothetical protein
MDDLTHLSKAKAALTAASTLNSGTDPIRYSDLLLIAHVQAEVAAAEALERIAYCLEERLSR